MNSNICNNCGGKYEEQDGHWICQACGSYMPQEISNEEATLLYMAFQKIRLAEFSEAEPEFDDIILKYPENPSGYWGRLMAKYSIKYEKDTNGRMVPTCYAVSIENLQSSPDYQQALQYANEETKSFYTQQINYIESVRKEWAEKASEEKPCDIFLSYKESDSENSDERTQDSIAAQELYTHLTDKGYHVFFSRESLREKTDDDHEPYIFNALATAKAMVVYGTKPDHINTPPVKNEWTRYEKWMQKGEKKPNSLIVACDGFSPAVLPGVLASKQCLNAADEDFYNDLDETIEKALHGEPVVPPTEEKHEEKREKKSQKLLIALLLLFVVSISGFFAWLHLSNTDTPEDPSTQGTTEHSSSTIPSQTTDTESTSTKYQPATTPTQSDSQSTSQSTSQSSTQTKPSTGVVSDKDITDEALSELITKKYLTVNEKSRPGYKLDELKAVVIHYVANPGTSALQNWKYFENKNYVSAHFIIDLDGSIIQCMPLDEVAWAIGTTEGNYSTISIECCHPDSTGKFTDATYESLVKLVSWLCNEYGLTADNVKRHYDYPRKNNSGVVWHKECPVYFVKHPEEWDEFLDSLLIQ